MPRNALKKSREVLELNNKIIPALEVGVPYPFLLPRYIAAMKKAGGKKPVKALPRPNWGPQVMRTKKC